MELLAAQSQAIYLLIISRNPRPSFSGNVMEHSDICSSTTIVTSKSHTGVDVRLKVSCEEITDRVMRVRHLANVCETFDGARNSVQCRRL
jgi:hypothetical protein